MEHYYTSKPTVGHDHKLLNVNLRGFDLQFETDAGVFSKNQIDFGSKLLIDTMDIPKESGSRILDLGCGYGPVGITAAKLAPQAEIVMVDINERAVLLTRENLLRNHVHNAYAEVSDIYSSIGEKKFHRILCNPPIRAGKHVVHQIFEEATQHLEADGELWIVIQKKQGAPSAKIKLEQLFHEVWDRTRDAGYRIFCAKGIRQLEEI